MWQIRRRISRRADEPYRLPARKWRAIGQTGRVGVEMRIHQDETIGGIRGVNHESPRLAREKLEHSSRCRGKNVGATRSGYVDRIVNASFPARLGEGVAKLTRHDPGHRDDDFVAKRAQTGIGDYDRSGRGNRKRRFGY